jgi:hypothetical protein
VLSRPAAGAAVLGFLAAVPLLSGGLYLAAATIGSRTTEAQPHQRL